MALLLALLLALPCAGAQLVLAEKNRPRVTIAIDSSAGPLAKRAAQILQNRIERITGVRVPIVAGARGAEGGGRIVIADPSGPDATRWIQAARFQAPSAGLLGEEGFLLRTSGLSLFVLAKEGRGLLYGVGKVLRTARYGPGSAVALPPEGIDKPACPSTPGGKAVVLRNKSNLFSDLAQGGVQLSSALIFPYDTGGCFCDRCKPWIRTFLNLTQDLVGVIRRFHPKARVYFTDWHCKDDEARIIIDFMNQRKPGWLAGIWKDDRHAVRRFAEVDGAYQTLTFMDITETGGCMGYSEGIYGDFNNAATAQLAWNPQKPLPELTAEMKLPSAIRDSWRWQVFSRRVEIGRLAAALEGGASIDGAKSRVQKKQSLLNEYLRSVIDLRNGVYIESAPLRSRFRAGTEPRA